MMKNPMNFDKEEYNNWIEEHKEWISVFIDDKVLEHFEKEQENIDEENFHGHMLYYLLNTAFLLKTNPILKYPFKDEALSLFEIAPILHGAITANAADFFGTYATEETKEDYITTLKKSNDLIRYFFINVFTEQEESVGEGIGAEKVKSEDLPIAEEE